MPDQAPVPGQTPAPPPAGAGGSPQPGQPAGGSPQPGQPAGGSPFGNSGATQPTPNRGYEAQALQGLGLVVMKLDEIVKMIGVTGELGSAVSETIKKLSKFVPPGSMTPTSQQNQINQLGMKAQANNQQMQQYLQSKQSGGGQPAPGAPAAGGQARAA